MEDIDNRSIRISEVRQSLLNAQELLDTLLRLAPTGQNRSVSERASQLLDEFVRDIEGFPRLQELNQAVEASLQSLGSRPLRVPPASKEVVANLPTIIVTEETLMRCAECAVCSDNLVINDKMQELPCKHLFHPLCLTPWLDKHNSCPICRHELPTDNEAYESWKKSEKEAEKARRDAANSVESGHVIMLMFSCILAVMCLVMHTEQ
ncbi:E3 ubiquitin-protein ligase AIP2-like [Papaver somniferum]|uniref:E3 ubiquitin-protein ligase AIP2-like n=1 Tax=Papaver somniferum TaxID=3469 RepID=UPI000E700F01|nr:E3 ubiquitin-protein ligase AIP2-like [Papaver somniferum]